MADAPRAEVAAPSAPAVPLAAGALDAALQALPRDGEEPNLLREGLRRERTAPPCAMVIFGASGDLTSRKLIPALYDLALQRLLPAGFSVIGTARQEMDSDSFRAAM